MFDDLVMPRGLPSGAVEHHLPEGAVMIAFAMHLLAIVPNLTHVAVHPDGEHGKRFQFRDWLARHGFEHRKPMGTTDYGGVYENGSGRTILVNPASGRGDVVADIAGHSFVAECKGGILDTNHPGQKSRLRRGLCECVGLLLSKPQAAGQRQFAVVPRTPGTEQFASQMVGRAVKAGIEIALVDGGGSIELVTGEAA